MSKILIAADDARLLEGFAKALGTELQVELARGANDARSHLGQHGPFAVLVADNAMRGASAIELLSQAHAAMPNSMRVMLVTQAEVEIANDAVSEGHITRYLVKPCSPAVLRRAVNGSLRQYRASLADQEASARALEGSVRMLTDILAIVHPTVFGRSATTRARAAALCKVLSVERAWEVEVAAMLADVGMVTLPASLLTKHKARVTLTGAEKDTLQRVPLIGADLLMNIPRMETVATLVRHGRKGFDGSGVPADSPGGMAIPLGSRVLRVLADLVDHEEHGMSLSKAFAEMHQAHARAYDPVVFEAAVECFTKRFDANGVPEGALPVGLDDLRLGQVLCGDMLTEEGMLLVKGGQVVTKGLLERIQNFASITEIREPVYVEKPSW